MHDPDKYKLPMRKRAELPTIYEEIREFLEGAMEMLSPDEFEEIKKDHVAFLLYGFISITGIHPRNAMLVERQYSDGSIGFSYQLKNPRTDWSTELAMKQKDHLIKSLESKLREAERQLAKLTEK